VFSVGSSGLPRSDSVPRSVAVARGTGRRMEKPTSLQKASSHHSSSRVDIPYCRGALEESKCSHSEVEGQRQTSHAASPNLQCNQGRALLAAQRRWRSKRGICASLSVLPQLIDLQSALQESLAEAERPKHHKQTWKTLPSLLCAPYPVGRFSRQQ
jgi:hypothetical protein